jgi:ABC-type phosphate/phosphonate transport system substrate-binding protein
MHSLARSLSALGSVGAFFGLLLGLAGASDRTKPIQIGMAKTFFAERSKSVVEIATDDFKDVLKKLTRLDGELISKYGAFEVAEKLNNKQLDLGILHAHEVAWVQKKYPELKPLLIAVNKKHQECAYLIVRKNSPAKSIADLRGKKLDMPAAAKEHCRLFLEKLCAAKDPKGPAAFFGSIAKSASPGEALDDVSRDKAQVTIVDAAALEFYKEVKGPVFEKNLRVLVQSEVFPPTAIVYKPGTLSQATLDQFRDGLLKAHTTEVGRDMMKEWNIDAFEAIPKDYAQRLAEVLKAYPAPGR